VAEAPIYLDNNATTPVDPRVLDAMLPFLRERFGNPSSRSHPYGWEAERAVEEARERVARLLGADAREIVFTSGATESNNLALRGAFEAREGGGGHVVTAATEHPSVLDVLAALERRGLRVTYLPVDRDGRVSAAQVEAALRPDTFVVSLMAANNEIGTLHPIREIGAVCEKRGVLFHTDATQAVGKVPFDVRKDHVHLASITAHKIYGPKGCGALYVRRRDPGVRLARQQHGGGQERGLRSGTLNVPGIVGLGAAAELCRLEREAEATRLRALRDRLYARLRDAIGDLVLNGHPEERLPGNLNVSIPGIESEALMMAAPEIAVSSGAACGSGSLEPSHVLRALGLRPELLRCPLRFGIGRFNTEADIDRAAAAVARAVLRLRKDTVPSGAARNTR